MQEVAGSDQHRAFVRFKVNIPEADLADLRRRINATKWPEKETVADASQGVQLATIQQLARYWATEYDWRKCEAKLNALPNFITEIDGLDIHFIHVRSKHENALPLIVTHGWPGSIIEQLKIIDPLTNPTAHGGSAADAFHLVIPSMPGYGFSGKPTTTGWDRARIARAWAVLMKRLGYTHYVAQGGDWGALVTEQMGVQAPAGLLGIHTNLPSAVPERNSQGAAVRRARRPASQRTKSRAFDQLAFFFTHGLAYAQQMANHPQALYGIADSPIGLAGWFLEQRLAGATRSSRAPSTDSDEGLTRTTCSTTSRLLADQHGNFLDPSLSGEQACLLRPDGRHHPRCRERLSRRDLSGPRSWAERAYPKLIHYNKLDKGGHFAAWEQPELFSEEVRAGFRSLRSAFLSKSTRGVTIGPRG